MRPCLLLGLALLTACAGCARDPEGTSSAGADSLSERIETLRGEGRYAEALPDAELRLRALRDCGDTAPWELGDAERLVRKLALAATLPDTARARLAVADSLSATLTGLFHAGEFQRARGRLERLLHDRRAVLVEPDADIATTLHRLGAINLQLGDYVAAAAYTCEALDMNRSLLEADHPRIASNLDNLAILLRRQGDFAGAEPLFREALGMYRRLHDGTHPGVARSLGNLAIFLSDKGDYADAEALYEKTLAMYGALHGPESEPVIRNLYNLGLMQSEQSHDAQAEATCSRALEMSRRVLGDAHPLTAGILHALGMVRYDLGRFASADSMLEEAVAVYAGTLGADHPYVAWALLDRGVCLAARGETARADSLLVGAAGIYERARAMAGPGYSRSVCQPSPYPTHATVLLRLGRPREAWRAAERAQSRALAELLMARGTPLAPDADPLPRVLAALEPGTALLGWLHVALEPDTPSTWGYVIDTRDGMRWVRLHPTLRDGEAREPGDFSLALERAGGWPFPVRDTARLDRLSRRLHREWIAPLLAEAGDARRLVAVPTGPLHGVPLEALPDGDGLHLGDRFEVSYAPSATLYAWLREQDRTATAPPPSGALLLGDPDYADPWLAGLPGTRAEVASLADALPGATVLLGAEASEARLRALNESGELSRFRWIHLATHALVDDEDPAASALLLCDGRLTAREIVSEWRLDADLVSLSGCRTGLGRRTAGEGFVGLTHAFLRAGARSLLVSLWPVEDTATSLLMGRFFDNLAGRRDGADIPPLDKSAALAEAKRWLRDGTDGAYRHPCYWSGFVLMGE